MQISFGLAVLLALLAGFALLCQTGFRHAIY